MIKRGLVFDKWVVSFFIDMYGKGLCVLEMKRAFDDMGCMEIGLCNVLVAGFVRNGFIDDVVVVFS